MTYDSKISVEEQWQTTYQNSAEARRVTLLDSGGDFINSLNPLPVNITTTSSDTAYHQYGTALVTYNTEATLLTYTVPAGNTLIITGINWGGEADGELVVYIDTVKTLVFRNSAANRTQFLTINDNNFIATTGQTVELKAKNVSHRQNAANFESTIIGGLA